MNRSKNRVELPIAINNFGDCDDERLIEKRGLRALDEIFGERKPNQCWGSVSARNDSSGMMAASASSSQVSEEEDANSSNLRRELLVKGVETEDLTRARQFFQNVRRVARLGVSLGLILAMDKALERGFTAAKIKFPSALFGMFSVVLVLLIVDGVRAEAATRVVEFFEPATTFIQRWLPLFYVPSLVVLPLAVKGIPVSSAPKIGAIIVGGWMASLCVAGYTAIAVRKMVKTNIVPAEPMPKPSPFSTKELWFGIIVFSFSFIFAFLSPTALGTSARTCLLFFLTATALGYIVGSRFPRSAQRLLHPIITCVLFANFAAFAFGFFTGLGYESMLGAYLTKSSSNPGAGDILMGFLGSVIISFAFSIFRQKRLVKRHAVEIFSGVMASTCFSLYSTAALGRVIGLEPTLTVCILPRCITLALALGIATLFEVTNPSLTAAVVVLTGLIGANFAQTLLDKLGLNDVIARGMATASSAHGFGTAALSEKEPEALPFCAIAYSLTGILATLLCSIPAVRQSLLFIAG